MRRQVFGAAVLEFVIGITTTTWTRAIEPPTGKGVFAGGTERVRGTHPGAI